MRSRHEDRERLTLETRSGTYQALLHVLQQPHHFLRQFHTWDDAISFMRSGTSQDPLKDEVLRPIFKAHTEDKDPRWRTILLLIFWPGLESIHFKKRHWDVDPDARWATILWIFLETVCRVDVRRRSSRLVQKVYNDVVHGFYDERRKAWARSKRETSIEPGDYLDSLVDKEEFEAFAGKVDCCVNFAGLGLREEMEAEIRRLREHVEAGRISEADYLLLVGTKVYRQSIADYAREAGLRYQTVRKRHQRAEAAMRRTKGEKL